MANRNIGTLSIDLIAKTAGFKEGMTAAEKQLDKMKRATDKIGAELARLGKAFAVAGAAIGAFVARGFGLADQMTETAEKLGLTTEALAGLQHAAAITGVETSELESGLVKMTKAVSEAARGTGLAQKALKQLGLDAKELSKLSPDEQFKAIAEAMEGVGVQGDKVQLALKIFKDADLVRTLALGAEGLDESAEAAERYGTALNAVQADEIEKADAAIENMQKAVEGLSIQMAAGFAPAIADAAETLTDFIVAIKNASEAFRFMDEAFLGFQHDVRSLNLNEINARIELTEDQIKNLIERMKEMQRLAPLNPEADTSYLLQIKNLEDELAELTKRLEELTKRKKQFAAAEIEVVPRLDLSRVKEELEATFAELDLILKQEVKEYNNELEAFANKFSTSEQRVKALRAELERFRADLSDNPDAIANAEAAIREEQIGGLEEITVNIRRRVTEPYKKAVDEMTEYTKQAKANMQDALADFLFDPFEDGLKGMLKNFADTLRQMAANMAASQIFSLFSTGGAGSNWIKNLFKASGGPVSAGQTYVVGERGPELFVQNALSGPTIPPGFRDLLMQSLAFGRTAKPLSAGSMSVVGARGPELFEPKISGSIMPNSFFESVRSNYDRLREVTRDSEMIRHWRESFVPNINWSILLRDWFGFGGGRASGGSVSAGMSYTVGERGPETFIPAMSGSIVPNNQQGPVVNITQVNNIEGSNLGPEQMVTILNENNKKLKGEFLQELRRGTYS